MERSNNAIAKYAAVLVIGLMIGFGANEIYSSMRNSGISLTPNYETKERANELIQNHLESKKDSMLATSYSILKNHIRNLNDFMNKESTIHAFQVSYGKSNKESGGPADHLIFKGLDAQMELLDTDQYYVEKNVDGSYPDVIFNSCPQYCDHAENLINDQ